MIRADGVEVILMQQIIFLLF